MSEVDYEAFADILPAPPRKKRSAPRAKFVLIFTYGGGSMEEEGTKRELVAAFEQFLKEVKTGSTYRTVTRVQLHREDGTQDGSQIVREWKR